MSERDEREAVIAEWRDVRSTKEASSWTAEQDYEWFAARLRAPVDPPERVELKRAFAYGFGARHSAGRALVDYSTALDNAWQDYLDRELEDDPTERGSEQEVGCERSDGLLHIHPESETCDVCSPGDERVSEASALREALEDCVSALRSIRDYGPGLIAQHGDALDLALRALEGAKGEG